MDKQKTIVFKVSDNIKEKMIEHYQDMVTGKPPYSIFQVKQFDCVITLYQVKNYDGELKINDGESKKLEFFSLDNLPQLESRAKAIIDKIKNGTIKL